MSTKKPTYRWTDEKRRMWEAEKQKGEDTLLNPFKKDRAGNFTKIKRGKATYNEIEESYQNNIKRLSAIKDMILPQKPKEGEELSDAELAFAITAQNVSRPSTIAKIKTVSKGTLNYMDKRLLKLDLKAERKQNFLPTHLVNELVIAAQEQIKNTIVPNNVRLLPPTKEAILLFRQAMMGILASMREATRPQMLETMINLREYSVRKKETYNGVLKKFKGWCSSYIAPDSISPICERTLARLESHEETPLEKLLIKNIYDYYDIQLDVARIYGMLIVTYLYFKLLLRTNRWYRHLELSNPDLEVYEIPLTDEYLGYYMGPFAYSYIEVINMLSMHDLFKLKVDKGLNPNQLMYDNNGNIKRLIDVVREKLNIYRESAAYMIKILEKTKIYKQSVKEASRIRSRAISEAFAEDVAGPSMPAAGGKQKNGTM